MPDNVTGRPEVKKYDTKKHFVLSKLLEQRPSTLNLNPGFMLGTLGQQGEAGSTKESA